MRLIDRPGPLVAARRRRSATVRVLLFIVVVIVVATAIVWGVNERSRTPGIVPGQTPASAPTMPAVALSPVNVFQSPTPVPTATATPTALPTATPTVTPVPTNTPVPTATPPPTMTPTPVVVVGCVEPVAVPAAEGNTQFVAEIGINLRAQPGLTCAIVSPILAFTEMTATSGPVSADGLTWIRVEVAGFTGWVATNNLRAPANG